MQAVQTLRLPYCKDGREIKQVYGDLTGDEGQILLCIILRPTFKCPPVWIVRPHLCIGVMNSVLTMECVRKGSMSFVECHVTCLLYAFCFLCQLLILKIPLLVPWHRERSLSEVWHTSHHSLTNKRDSGMSGNRPFWLMSLRLESSWL